MQSIALLFYLYLSVIQLKYSDCGSSSIACLVNNGMELVESMHTIERSHFIGLS